MCDAFALQRDYSCKTGDAEGAYTQAYLLTEDGSVETWIQRPRDRWPPEWEGKYHDPWVRLNLALYGHPDAGGYLEDHCDQQLRKVGFSPVGDAWPSVYWHQKFKALLCVYVDDSKLAAPTVHQDELWVLIKSVSAMGDETDDGRYLGCDHREFTATAADVTHIPDANPSYHPRQKERQAAKGQRDSATFNQKTDRKYDPFKKIRGNVMYMRGFLDQCLESYCNLTNIQLSDIRRAPAPFADESKFRSIVTDKAGTTTNGSSMPSPRTTGGTPSVRGDSSTDEVAAAPKRKSKRKKQPDKSLRSDDGEAKTLDAQSIESDAEVDSNAPGELNTIAASVLMKVLYLERCARNDLLRAIGALASFMTKRTRKHDVRLHRVMQYLRHSRGHFQIGFIGDAWSELELVTFTDADLAGSKSDF